MRAPVWNHQSLLKSKRNASDRASLLRNFGSVHHSERHLDGGGPGLSRRIPANVDPRVPALAIPISASQPISFVVVESIVAVALTIAS